MQLTCKNAFSEKRYKTLKLHVKKTFLRSVTK